MSKKIKVLSLFDGISCAQVALKKLRYKVEYYASEIDKYAIEVTQKRHPKTTQLGDVKELTIKNRWKIGGVGKIDLLIGGSPCQDLSIAKRGRKGLKGKKSSLFYEYLRILKEVKPKYFILENVASMPKAAKEEITKQLGVEPIMLNASLVSAQLRRRLFWTNIKNIKLPKDKEIYLKDILEKGGYTEKAKSYALTATYSRACPRDYFLKSSRQLIFKKPVRIGKLGKGGQGNRIYSVDGKSICLSATSGGKGANTGLYLINGKKSIIAPNGKKMELNGKPPFCFKEARTKEGKKYRSEERKKTGKDITLRNKKYKKYIPRKDNKANCLTTGLGVDGMVAFKKYVRRLTPVECERLQSLPDNYTKGLSNTQRYKTLGNAFNVEVVKHILKNI